MRIPQLDYRPDVWPLLAVTAAFAVVAGVLVY
ncbi:MAG: hypothetical protein QOG83_2784 [Alphaproteobacteria bacterium]|jgi:hypothetical protein|nr:hypothetical protein [Alphaproteobacteria bacterium]